MLLGNSKAETGFPASKHAFAHRTGSAQSALRLRFSWKTLAILRDHAQVPSSLCNTFMSSAREARVPAGLGTIYSTALSYHRTLLFSHPPTLFLPQPHSGTVNI